MSNHLSISIAICSYNPDLRLLHRLLASVSRLTGLESIDDIILIDNNSSPRIIEHAFVRNFFNRNKCSRYLIEHSQGLTHARLRAIAECYSDVIIFFDDDNEPCRDYVEIVRNAFTNYPSSGVWGPGQITVDFVDGAPPEVRRNSRSFQERDVAFGYVCTEGEWSPFCPFGTGMAVRRQVLDAYEKAFKAGRLTRSDRKGNSLSSAGDVQIVWESFRLGMSAGVIPILACNHMINADKANKRYLKSLIFWTASSYRPALLESFPSHWSSPQPSTSYLPLLALISSKYLTTQLKNIARSRYTFEHSLAFAKWLGSIHGGLEASNDRFALLILRIAKVLQIA